jgi:hypothetical protein
VRKAEDLPVPNVKKIRGLNLPGTPWATSARCGRPLFIYFFNFVQISCNKLRVLSCCGIVFQNSERKHRTEVFVLVVTEELPEWEDAKNMGTVWLMEILRLSKTSGIIEDEQSSNWLSTTVQQSKV